MPYQNYTDSIIHPFEYIDTLFDKYVYDKSLEPLQFLPRRQEGKRCTTILHVAARENDILMMNLALKEGEDVDSVDENNKTPLHIAAEYNSRDAVKFLCLMGANVNAKEKSGAPLHAAAAKNHADVIQDLCMFSADIEANDNDKNTPLHVAGACNSVDAIHVLCQSRANKMARNFHGHTPLHVAARNDKAFAVLAFLEEGVDIEVQTLNNHHTPLLSAVSCGANNALLALCQNGANPNAKNLMGYTALHIAAWYNQPVACQILCSFGAYIDARDSSNNTPSHFAAAMDNCDVLQILLQEDADINAKNINSITPLHVAAGKDNVKIIHMLCQAGANKESINASGNTALHIAVLQKKIAAIHALLLQGADKNAKNLSNLTPLQIAITINNLDVMLAIWSEYGVNDPAMLNSSSFSTHSAAVFTTEGTVSAVPMANAEPRIYTPLRVTDSKLKEIQELCNNNDIPTSSKPTLRK